MPRTAAPERDFLLGKLRVRVYENVTSLSEAAADDVARAMVDALAAKAELNLVLSGAESQEVFLQSLAGHREIDWARVNYFAVDEFYAPGMALDMAVSVQPIRILSGLSLKSLNVLDPHARSIVAERRRYEELIRLHRPDVACLGIGRSGHIAFNEPGQCDLRGSEDVRIIAVDDDSIAQLRDDPNFQRLGEIPSRAMTVTLPFLMSCPVISVVVPFAAKAPVIRRLVDSTDVSADFPATVLKEQASAVLYLDRESYGLC